MISKFASCKNWGETGKKKESHNGVVVGVGREELSTGINNTIAVLIKGMCDKSLVSGRREIVH